jgi:hypothetical protein
MKKLFSIAIAIAFFSQQAGAQMSKDSLKTLSDHDLGMYYRKQNKQQKTIGWVLLGGGLALGIIGINQMANDLFSDSNRGEALWLIGDVAVIASIPLFISAAKNKGRAEILLRNQNVPLSIHSGTKLLTVGLRIPLGKN